MDAEPQPLELIYAPVALREIDEIWDWNLENNGYEQAQAYVAFLRDRISSLVTEHQSHVALIGRPDLRFMVMKWSAGGHSHIAVYKVNLDRGTVTIAHVFHTRQNWKQALKKEKR